MLGNFSGVKSEGLYLSVERKKENSCLVFTSSIKRCFADLNLLLFLPLSLPSPSSLLKLPIFFFCTASGIAFFSFTLEFYCRIPVKE